jgi:hypothetical protein
MGNTRWRHFVPYQEDVWEALRNLRRRIFSEGAFRKGPAYADDESPKSLAELVQRTGYNTHSALDVAWVIRPSQIEAYTSQAIHLEHAQGTVVRLLPFSESECLDYPAVPNDVASLGRAIYPLSRDQVYRLFGTERPTRWMFPEADKILWYLGCVYITVYEDLGRLDDADARPVEICFSGMTGGR